MVMVTTNHLERIDPAIGQPGSIGSRPGRIDRIVSMGLLDGERRRKLADRILGDWPQWIDDVCIEGNEDTPAQFQERCGRLALKLHYGEFRDVDRDAVNSSDEVILKDRAVNDPERIEAIFPG